MNNNFNMMPNQLIDSFNFNRQNPLLINPNINQISPYINQINPNINQINPNFNEMNPNINQMNPNINQINPNINQMNQNICQTNPNLNQMNPNINQMNPNITQINPNNNQINENFNQINPNFNEMNPNFNQINPNINPINPNNNQINLNNNQNLAQSNQNMNLSNMNQIEQNIPQLNINDNEKNFNQQMPFKQNNSYEKIEDVLPYIDEPKMVLKFSNINTNEKGDFITVKIPKSLTKAELYTIAKKYQVDYFSNILLSCNNYLLKEDNTEIDGLKEGSIINIIENVDFPDSSYYKSLMKKNENYQRINYFFRFNGKINKIKFPKNITVSELKKAALSKLLLNSKGYTFNIFCHDNRKIKDEFPENKTFWIYQSNPIEPHHWKFGKYLVAKTYDIKNNPSDIDIGNLNSINDLMVRIELHYGAQKIKKITINGNEYFKNEIKNFSLKSIGINEDFVCKVEFQNK